MSIRIKNWAQFQHFKDRKPPWVKLYRDILDDIEWHELDPKAAKALVMMWLIASESDGNLPEVKKLAFRLRMSEKETNDCISKLSHWLEQDDINEISSRYQSAPAADVSDHQEVETEERQRKDRRAGDFKTFYEAYPKKRAPADAEKAFAKVDAPIEVLLAAISRQSASEDWLKDSGQYIPYPATWLNQRQWENVIEIRTQTVPAPANADAALQKIKADAAKAAPPSLETLERMAQLRKSIPQGAH